MNTYPALTTFDCGHVTFRIIFTSDNAAEEWAHTDFAKFQIVINQCPNEEMLKSSLLHEIMHVALWNIGLGEDEDIPQQMTNEFMVMAVSNQIMTFKNLNKEVFNYIFT